MTENTKIKGNWGENLACRYLASQGFSIQERNWRFGRAEVDIIVQKDELLIFVEVKVRKNTDFGLPEEAVNHSKQAQIAMAAAAYCEKVQHHGDIRFDIVSIVGDWGRSYQLKHLEDAFFPGLFG